MFAALLYLFAHIPLLLRYGCVAVLACMLICWLLFVHLWADKSALHPKHCVVAQKEIATQKRAINRMSPRSCLPSGGYVAYALFQAFIQSHIFVDGIHSTIDWIESSTYI